MTHIPTTKASEESVFPAKRSLNKLCGRLITAGSTCDVLRN